MSVIPEPIIDLATQAYDNQDMHSRGLIAAMEVVAQYYAGQLAVAQAAGGKMFGTVEPTTVLEAQPAPDLTDTEDYKIRRDAAMAVGPMLTRAAGGRSSSVSPMEAVRGAKVFEAYLRHGTGY